MKRSLLGTIGLVILGAGIIVLAYGAYQYYDASQSLRGGIAKAFNKMSKDHIRALYEMAAGGAAVVVGFLLSRSR